MKIKVTIAEQIFCTYEVELEIDEKEPTEDQPTFEEWFCELEEPNCIQDEVHDRDFSFWCAKCNRIFEPGSQDNLSPYCDECREKIEAVASGKHKGEGI